MTITVVNPPVSSFPTDNAPANADIIYSIKSPFTAGLDRKVTWATLKTVVLSSSTRSINTFSTLSVDQVLVGGVCYLINGAAARSETLPPATGSGALIAVKTTASNVGFTEIIPTGAETLEMMGLNYSSLTSTGAMTVYLRDILSGVWSIDSIIGAWTAA